MSLTPNPYGAVGIPVGEAREASYLTALLFQVEATLEDLGRSPLDLEKARATLEAMRGSILRRLDTEKVSIALDETGQDPVDRAANEAMSFSDVHGGG